MQVHREIMENYYVQNYGQRKSHQFKPIQSVDDSTLNQPAIYWGTLRNVLKNMHTGIPITFCGAGLLSLFIYKRF